MAPVGIEICESQEVQLEKLQTSDFFQIWSKAKSPFSSQKNITFIPWTYIDIKENSNFLLALQYSPWGCTKLSRSKSTISGSQGAMCSHLFSLAKPWWFHPWQFHQAFGKFAPFQHIFVSIFGIWNQILGIASLSVFWPKPWLQPGFSRRKVAKNISSTAIHCIF